MKRILLTILTLGLLLGLTVASAVPLVAASVTNPQVQTLFAGQDIDVGTVSVWNDADDLFVEYATTGGWEITETHLAVGSSLDDIPQTKTYNPIPGKFTYKNEHDPSVTEFTYTVSLPGDWFALRNQTLVIAAHAAVEKIGSSESAWADGSDFAGKNWATYFTYNSELSAEEACALIQANEGNADFHIFDVRKPAEFFLGHIEGAVNLTYSSSAPEIFEAAVDVYDKDGTYLVYCKSDYRGYRAVEIMIDLGFTDVHNLDGGIQAWVAAVDATEIECGYVDLTGDWLLSVNGGSYEHDMSILTIDPTPGSYSGTTPTVNITGTGSYPAGGPYTITWIMTGSFNGPNITMNIDYGTGYTATDIGTIADDLNSMAGTWSDSNSNSGTWTATRVP